LHCIRNANDLRHRAQISGFMAASKKCLEFDQLMKDISTDSARLLKEILEESGFSDCPPALLTRSKSIEVITQGFLYHIYEVMQTGIG